MMDLFKDRVDAGKKLARILLKYKNKNAIILAIPRGGVIIGNEVAKTLGKKLDIVVPRKIGSPLDPEFAIGAVAQDGSVFLDDNVVEDLHIGRNYIDSKIKEELEEIKRRVKAYRGDRKLLNLAKKYVILVDDGIATGYTMRASVKFVNKQKPTKIIVAVPVAPSDFQSKLEADEFICLRPLEPYYAISMHYLNFGQTTDEEVIEILKNQS